MDISPLFNGRNIHMGSPNNLSNIGNNPATPLQNRVNVMNSNRQSVALEKTNHLEKVSHNFQSSNVSVGLGNTLAGLQSPTVVSGGLATSTSQASILDSAKKTLSNFFGW